MYVYTYNSTVPIPFVNTSNILYIVRYNNVTNKYYFDDILCADIHVLYINILSLMVIEHSSWLFNYYNVFDNLHSSCKQYLFRVRIIVSIHNIFFFLFTINFSHSIFFVSLNALNCLNSSVMKYHIFYTNIINIGVYIV